MATIRPTTWIESARLSDRLGCQVVIASETFQHTGSFKFRAAYNVAANVPNPRIITASSGNFGQALAYACKLLGKGCTVVMPHNSVAVKVDAVRSYGATVDLVNTVEMSRAGRVQQLSDEQPDAYVASAYDDPLVIEGNSSLGTEIAARGGIDCVIAPVGGGGLTSGIAMGLQRKGYGIELFGAEPLMANDAARSLREGRIVTNEQEPQSIADGARTVSLGEHNWAVLKESLAGVVEVPEANIRDGVRLLFQLANLKSEPTGALAIGALLTDPGRFSGRRVCCVISGGNADPAAYAELIAGDSGFPPKRE